MIRGIKKVLKEYERRVGTSFTIRAIELADIKEYLECSLEEQVEFTENYTDLFNSLILLDEIQPYAKLMGGRVLSDDSIEFVYVCDYGVKGRQSFLTTINSYILPKSMVGKAGKGYLDALILECLIG